MKFFLTAAVLSSIAAIVMAATTTNIKCTNDAARDRCAAIIRSAPTRFDFLLRQAPGPALGSLVARKSTAEDCIKVADEFLHIGGCQECVPRITSENKISCK